MPNLTVVLDGVAAMRQIMPDHGPDPAAAAIIAQLAGADGIAIHLREDRRDVQERDVRTIRQLVDRRLILHMAPTSEMVGFALDIKPERVILVPEINHETTQERVLDLIIHAKNLFETVDTLQSTGISVGICIAPEPEQTKLAHQIRASWVQIHAGRLFAAVSAERRGQEMGRITDTVKMAHRLRLKIAIGHGLDLKLLKLFKGLPEIDEISIGQSLITDALLKGMQTTVCDTIDLIRAL
ncbi:MAG: pyridoxine 5'-phosphate synthase [Desulfobacteraceae bacterium]|jgi:pyridoxine 5-phosphate synthase